MKNIMVYMDKIGMGLTDAIVGINACAFDIDLGEVYDPVFMRSVSITSSVPSGFVVSPDRSALKRATYGEIEPVSIVDALTDLSGWYLDQGQGLLVWSNSPGNISLRMAFGICSVNIPWNYIDNRCFRTLLASSYRGRKCPTMHNSVHQAELVISLLRGKTHARTSKQSPFAGIVMPDGWSAMGRADCLGK